MLFMILDGCKRRLWQLRPRRLPKRQSRWNRRRRNQVPPSSRVPFLALLSQRKVDRLGSPGSGYGLHNGSSVACHLNSIMILVRVTSVVTRHLLPQVYAPISSLISKLNSVWPERLTDADVLTKSREGANGPTAATCTVIAKLLIVRGL